MKVQFYSIIVSKGAVPLIEVITYAECAIRLPEKEDYESHVTNLLRPLKETIVTEEIVSISKPNFNPKNGTIETDVLARFVLNIPEQDKKKNVEDYVDDILPFLKRHVPKCNRITNIKIVQMKRALERK